MSFVMIAPGPTSSGARVRTVPIRALALAGVLAALLLLGAGFGLGWWIAAPAPAAAPPAAATRPQAASHALPFALEQLGALSGRLFRLESQARQLSDRCPDSIGHYPIILLTLISLLLTAGTFSSSFSAE